MRRMNYPRFDKPTYVGTYNEDDGGFNLDESKGFFINHDPEPGIYFVIIKDTENYKEYSCMFTIANINTYASWYSPILDDFGKISYMPGDGNLITTSPVRVLSAGSTIELYKLN